MDYQEFLEKLKALCLKFDSKAGWWPEHDLEGFAIYQFAANPPKEPIGEYELEELYKNIDLSEEGQEYLKELKKIRN